MTFFTLIAVVVAALLIGFESLRGVSELTRREEAARLSTYRRLLSVAVDARLSFVAHTVENIATSDALASAAKGDPEPFFEGALAANAGCVDALAIVDGSGRVLASTPATDVPAQLTSASAVAGTAAVSEPAFLHDGGDGDAKPLWALRLIPGSDGLFLAARVRPRYVYAALDEVAAETDVGAAMIVDQHGHVMAAGEGDVSVDPGSIEMTPAGVGGGGDAVVKKRGISPLTGYYGVVSGAPELGWRVVVLESPHSIVDAVRTALLPSAVVAVIACCVAVVSVLVYGRRVAEPLAAFERRARDIASGGYVRPMLLRRDDELGRLADAFNAMGVRLNSLQDTAQLLASTSRTDDLLDAVLSATGHLIGTTDTAVLLADDEGRVLRLARGHGIREPDLGFAIPVDEPSPVAAAFRERLAMPLEGQSTKWAHSVFRLFDAENDRTGVAVPLVAGEHALGVVVALSAGRHPLTEAHVETLRAFCAQAAVALHTSRLFQHERSSRTEAEALREAAELVAGAGDLDVTLKAVAEIAARLLGMRSGIVAVEDREAFGLPESKDPVRERALLEAWRSAFDASERHVGTPEPLLLRGSETGPAGLAEGPSLLVPLVREDAVKGVLALTGGTGAPLGRREIAAAGALGKQLSIAIENAALLRDAHMKAANLETVFRISQAVSSSLQIGVVLNRVLDVVQKIFSADAVALMSFDARSRQVATSMARGIANREMLYFQVAPGEDVPGAVFESRDPVCHADLGTVDTPLARLAVAQGLRSVVAVPLLARGRSTGVLLAYDARPGAFSEEDVELLLTFASQAALAIDTAGLYSKEHHVASILQASILPARPPEAPGLDIDGFYLPASTEAEIGGDFYDVFTTRDGTVVVAIGDVCGKGVLAATKTSMIKYSLQGMVAAGAEPAAIFEELNRLVVATGDPADILTAWVGYLDADRRVLTYACAGHPPALLRRSEGRRFERLAATGPLLGGVPGARYGTRETAVGPGDLLLTYTDGVTEARRGRRLFGEGRLRRVMLHSATATEAIDGLLEAVSTFSTGAMRDDAAALAVRIVGDGGHERVSRKMRRVDSQQARVG